ncbi:unnamed protein product [Hydatigera taeniaeformis]|uniref:PH domain-containing protein n=1 Tax=Hydatigena taeniaeformis TaxID=6205 RepID=A0A158RF17_HYDTA|nr:unnamed protein product [Hydatigera taeniaeformis]
MPTSVGTAPEAWIGDSRQLPTLITHSLSHKFIRKVADYNLFLSSLPLSLYPPFLWVEEEEGKEAVVAVVVRGAREGQEEEEENEEEEEEVKNTFLKIRLPTPPPPPPPNPPASPCSTSRHAGGRSGAKAVVPTGSYLGLATIYLKGLLASGSSLIVTLNSMPLPPSSRLRIHEVSFSEHWCRLKGNLLVILRNEGVHSTDLVGVVFLERCSAKPVTDADVQHAFQIDFECGDTPLLFAARSAEEANMWCNHIRMAGLFDLSARRLQLREELRQLTGKDPLDPLNPLLSLPESTCSDEFSEAGLELQLSLLDENASFSRISGLSFKIVTFLDQSGDNDSWKLVGETEIRTKDCPNFLKTVKLRFENASKTSMVKFDVMEFKDLRASVHRVVASAQTTLDALCNASTLNLPLVAESKSSTRTSATDCVLVVQVLNRRSNALDFDHLDVHSQQLRNVCEDILTRNYVFPHTLGENMRVVEFMGESRFCFQFPIEYLKSLITQEHLLYDSLLRVGMSNPTLECLRKERLLGMKNIIEFYELCLRSTVDHTGPSFKRSTERKCAELDFVPTNLHANRIGLLDSESRLILLHTWERAEESLWCDILSNAAATAGTETASTGLNLRIASSVWDSVHCRHHAVLCQALTASLTGLALAVTNWTPVEWKQMVRCGVPLHFEGLLSCSGEEICMLENWAWAIQSLGFCHIVIRPYSSPMEVTKRETTAEKEPKERNGGGQCLTQVRILRHNEILLTIPRSAWNRVPPECQARGRIVLSLHPFHFNVGINEQQSIAERLERVSLQSLINANGLTSLRMYFDKYTRKFGAPRKTPTQQDVCDVLSSLQYELEANKSKPVEVLRLATEVSSALNALRFTSCKSAKDRTGMAISLEQTRWLMEVEGMHKDSFSPALKCLRSTGLRLSNVEKNINVRKYSFTRFQVLAFPKAYRPPVGTYSLHVPS